MKKALVTGISGQDGAYLAKLLLQNGYDVWGTSRDAQISSFHNLERVGIRKDVQLASVALNDFRSVLQVLFKVQPDEIYNLAGQSSVSLSFEQPVETQDSIYLGTLNLLEAIRFTGKAIKLYNASSSECFGDLGGQQATEETAFRPRSPYAVAKSAAFWQVSNYREAYHLFACDDDLSIQRRKRLAQDVLELLSRAEADATWVSRHRSVPLMTLVQKLFITVDARYEVDSKRLIRSAFGCFSHDEFVAAMALVKVNSTSWRLVERELTKLFISYVHREWTRRDVDGQL